MPAKLRGFYLRVGGPTELRALHLLRVGGLRPPGPVAAPRASALRAPSRPVPLRRALRATPYLRIPRRSGSVRLVLTRGSQKLHGCSEWREAHVAGGRGGKERVARLRAERRRAAGGAAPRPVASQCHATPPSPRPVTSNEHATSQAPRPVAS